MYHLIVQSGINSPVEKCKKNKRRILRRRLRKAMVHVTSVVLTVAFSISAPVGAAQVVGTIDAKKVSKTGKLVKKIKSILKFTHRIINCVAFCLILSRCLEAYNNFQIGSLVYGFADFIKFLEIFCQQ